jgi:hypothetical protein
MELPDSGGEPIDGWTADLFAVLAWHAQHGRLPHHNSRRRPPTEEDRLARFLSAQRRRQSLLADQRSALLAIPGFSFMPDDDRFDARASAFAEFLSEGGREPTRRRRSPADEQVLAEWARNVRRSLRLGQLSYTKVSLLRKHDLMRWFMLPTSQRARR